MFKNYSESGASVAIKEVVSSLKNKTPIIDKTKPAMFTIKIANNLEEREAVFKLGYQIYRDKGFIDKNPQEWLVRSYDANIETVILIVQDQNKNIAGSVTLVFDGDSKLPAERIYGDEIKNLKDRGHHIIEISRLIISPEYRHSKEILLLLFNYLAIYCRKNTNYSCLIMQVNPRHKRYYKSTLKFDEIGIEKSSPQLNNAPAVLLNYPIARYRYEIKSLSENGTQSKNRTLYHYFLKPEQENLVAYYLKNQVNPITADEKIYFGLTGSSLGKAVCL